MASETGNAGCSAWVEINSRVYPCDRESSGFVHREHSNEEVGIRWASPTIREAGRTHGIRSTYLYGCRCEDCTAAARPARRRRHHNQQRATASAPSRYKEWTGPELEIAAREDLTTREVALMLGRTFSGVKGMRAKLLRDPRKQALAGTDYRQ